MISNQLSVASANKVLSKLSMQGARVVGETESSIELEYNNETVFIPQPVLNDGYTEDQLCEIERIIAVYGLDLLPLDDHLH